MMRVNTLAPPANFEIVRLHFCVIILWSTFKTFKEGDRVLFLLGVI